MRAFVHNLPRFSSAGSAGTRRILLTGAAVIGVVGVVVVVAIYQRSAESPSQHREGAASRSTAGRCQIHTAL